MTSLIGVVPRHWQHFQSQITNNVNKRITFYARYDLLETAADMSDFPSFRVTKHMAGYKFTHVGYFTRASTTDKIRLPNKDSNKQQFSKQFIFYFSCSFADGNRVEWQRSTFATLSEALVLQRENTSREVFVARVSANSFSISMDIVCTKRKDSVNNAL